MSESFIQKLARKADFIIARTEQLGERQIAKHIRRLNAEYGFDIAFDVGGNIGQYGRLLRKSGFKKQIITFEPIPELASQIGGCADAQWTVVNKGLGSVECRQNFNVMASSPMSSLLEPATIAGEKLADLNIVKNVIEVDITTLDKYIIDNNNIEFSRGILKLDVQGFEKQCLLGATQSLGKFIALQIELSVTPLYKNMDSYIELLRFIDELGFKPSIFASQSPFQFPKIIDFDAIFVRNI